MSPIHIEQVLRILQGAENDLFPVFSARAMWRETLAIVKANDNIPFKGGVVGWMARMYAHYALIGVRRQLSNNPTDVSLRRVLELVFENAPLFTRAEFVAGHHYTDPDDIAFANGRFDEWGPDGAAHLDPSLVRADIDSLKAVAEHAANFATKTVAHLDREYAYPEGIVDIDKITWNDIDDAMDQIEVLLLKYYPLVHGSSLSSATPVPILGWQRAYTVPWIPAGDGHR